LLAVVQHIFVVVLLDFSSEALLNACNMLQLMQRPGMRMQPRQRLTQIRGQTETARRHFAFTETACEGKGSKLLKRSCFYFLEKRYIKLADQSKRLKDLNSCQRTDNQIQSTKR